MEETTKSPLGLSTSQAAHALGVSLGTIRRWSDMGYLESYRTPGGQRRFSRGLDRGDFRVHPLRRLFLISGVPLGFEFKRQFLAAGLYDDARRVPPVRSKLLEQLLHERSERLDLVRRLLRGLLRGLVNRKVDETERIFAGGRHLGVLCEDSFPTQHWTRSCAGWLTRRPPGTRLPPGYPPNPGGRFR